ncbi:HNH endonuclease [Burkholderia cenocepacia]|uniref:HNH endonuclease n=1 Tax=Burkholderia cenocepacia TaxID=95486 RepID=UPI002866CC23|nr:HNH endonuclease signature motif containing protein [Burkholderia cenocepacia]MDR8028487.1 HNH endonuclease [Burkholderia cenocepacia]MDR8045724.1 HNH endonuclease [Burkholderia cenocepacia]MDR8076644.1 HNH endonuclease [Burkholderia cenocepacia]
MPQYSVKVGDIEDVVRELGGRAPYKKIYEALLAKFSSGKLPENYQDMATFQATVRRKVEDHCPQCIDFDPSKREAKFIRIERGTFELAQYEGQVAELQTVQERQAAFDKDVDRALADTSAARRKRLARANKKPAKIKAVTEIYVRSADVVAEVLLRANGACERCKVLAPFLRKKDRTPYLEVHHKQRLADDGEDTVENAIALCPNCHRELHFGVES